MKSIATIGVRNQLRFAFAVVIVLSFLATAIAIWRLQVLSDDTQALTQRPLVKERLISGWLLNTSVAAKRTGAIARSADPELATYYAAETQDSTTRTTALQKQVGDLLDTPEERAVFERIGTARLRFRHPRHVAMPAALERFAELVAQIGAHRRRGDAERIEPERPGTGLEFGDQRRTTLRQYRVPSACGCSEYARYPARLPAT